MFTVQQWRDDIIGGKQCTVVQRVLVLCVERRYDIGAVCSSQCNSGEVILVVFSSGHSFHIGEMILLVASSVLLFSVF